MLQELLNQQKQSLDFFFNQLDLSEGEALLEKLYSFKGNLFFTGIGKSGQVAQKLSSTFTSTGTKAQFIHPVEALHGDIGGISREDIVIFLSKSGQSKELGDFAHFLKQKKVFQVLWTSKEDSFLARFMDLICLLPLERELCPYNLSPTTSPLLQMCFGDTLAIALMQKKQFSLAQYAENHPSGFIGTRSRKVEEMMISKEALPMVFPTQSLKEVVVEMSLKRLGCVLIVDEIGYLKGIFTTGDLNRALVNVSEDILQSVVAEWMTTNFTAISQEALVDEALEIMQNPDKRMQMLPVIASGVLVGLIHLHDVVENTVNRGKKDVFA